MRAAHGARAHATRACDTLTVKVDDQIGRSMTPEADVVELGDNVILFPFGGRRASLQA